MGEQQEINVAPENWHRVGGLITKNALDNDYFELRTWLRDNIHHNWHFFTCDQKGNKIATSIYFEDKDEALLFALTWG